MKKNLKKLLSTSLVFLGLLSFGVSPETVLASDTKEYEVNNMEELKEIISNLNSELQEDYSNEKNEDLRSDELEKLISETNPDILKDYTEKINDEIKDIINNAEGLECIVNTNDVTNSTQTFELSDGGIVEITQTISPLDNKNINARTFYPWGDNEYEVDYRVKHTLYPDTHLCLVTTFDVNKQNIECTSSSTKGTATVFPVTVTKSSKVYKSKASKKDEYIGAQGDYTVTVGGYDGIGFVSMDYTIKSKIKLNYIGTSGAEVKASYSAQ